LNYDHRDKIGNQGDLIKHFALSCAIDTYPRKTDQFSYLDVHSGRAEYPLQHGGAWTRGIGAFTQRYASSQHHPNQLAHFYRLLALDKLTTDRRYPGSSGIVSRALRQRGINNIHLHLCDTSPDVCASLAAYYADNEQVHIYCEDGYLKARQLTGLDLVFIDPPDMDEHFHPYVQLLRYCLQQEQPFIAWNSLHGNTAGNHMSARCQAISDLAKVSRTAQIAVRWQHWHTRMCGCQMLFSLHGGDKLVDSCQSLAQLMQWTVIA